MKASLTEETIIGSQKITKAELRKFFKETLQNEYENYAVIIEDVLKKIFVYGTPFKGITLKKIIENRANPSWYEEVAQSITSFHIQKSTKVKIEDVILPYCYGDRRKAALDFVAYLRINKTPLKWDAWNTWKAHSKNKVLCWVKLNPFSNPTTWTVSPCLTNINVYEDKVMQEGLAALVWDNIKRCHPNCYGVCSGAKNIELLGKEFFDICNEVYEVNNIKIDFVNPNAITIKCIEKLLRLEETARTKKGSHDLCNVI